MIVKCIKGTKSGSLKEGKLYQVHNMFSYGYDRLTGGRNFAHSLDEAYLIVVSSSKYIGLMDHKITVRADRFKEMQENKPLKDRISYININATDCPVSIDGKVFAVESRAWKLAGYINEGRISDLLTYIRDNFKEDFSENVGES